MSEEAMSLMNLHRRILEQEYTLLFPPQPVLEKAIRKDLTLECARRAGIAVPGTAYPRSLADLRNCGLAFPVVLKPVRYRIPMPDAAFPYRVLHIKKLEELRVIFERIPPGEFPMVQEYVPGYGVGMSLLIRGSKAVLAFQHRRIREFPTDGGVGVLCEAMELDPILFEQTQALLVEMGWEGVAMVEYRYDPDTRRYALIEVNGRFWGSLPTAIYAGADFPYWLYRSSLPGAPAPPREYRAGVRARWLAGDTRWLLWALKNRKNRPVLPAIFAYLSSFRPSIRPYIWAWDDPKPAILRFIRRLWTQRPLNPPDWSYEVESGWKPQVRQSM
jgi:predicted ATP-grasp superfamily ATP-dependent carboligase